MVSVLSAADGVSSVVSVPVSVFSAGSLVAGSVVTGEEGSCVPLDSGVEAGALVSGVPEGMGCSGDVAPCVAGGSVVLGGVVPCVAGGSVVLGGVVLCVAGGCVVLGGVVLCVAGGCVETGGVTAGSSVEGSSCCSSIMKSAT